MELLSYMEPSRADVPAPALARGIHVLEFIQTRGPCPLDTIARHTRVPKSSLLRLLETLLALDLVENDRHAKTYRARAHLVRTDTHQDVEMRLALGLDQLVKETGLTAEWWVSTRNGMLLVRRAEPTGPDSGIVAQVGFLRNWEGELDAVASLAVAFLGEQQVDYGVFSGYLTDGVMTPLSESQAMEKIGKAREQGYVVDDIFNGNGVRRLACIVGTDRPIGVLSLAERLVPGEQHTATNLKLLRKAAEALNVR